MIIGIDIGGTNFRIGEVEKGIVVNSKKIKSSDVLKSEDTINDLAIFLKDYIADKKIEAISIGFPATLDKDRKMVLQMPNLKAIENIPVVDELSRILDIPVYIERDANMCLYYDINKYHLQDKNVVVGVYFGTGIGSSIFIGGKPYGGKDGVAGEVGHIPVDGVEYKCGCGNIGCMEEVAGGKYLTRINEEVFHDDIADLFVNHKDDPLLKQYVDRMAMTISTYLNILDPDTILIGGGIINMKNFPIDELKERVIFHTRKPEPVNSLNLIITEDENDKGIIGAYYYALDKK